MQVFHLVAWDQNRIIGKQGQLPWHCPEDLQRFKKLTMGHAIIMGRKTYDSIGRCLPGRRTIVVSRNPKLTINGAEVVASIDVALEKSRSDQNIWGDRVFIVGGSEIYHASLDLIDGVFATELNFAVEQGDASYPELDPKRFALVDSQVFAQGTFNQFERLI